MQDVIVIGAGVIGSAISRELSKYELNVLVLEKSEDIATGVSKANTGVVHAGFHFDKDTLKGKLNIKGNKMFKELSSKLDFPYEQNGALILGYNENEMQILKKLNEKGKTLNLPLKLLSKKEILKLEPNVSKNILGGLYSKTTGIVSPYEMTIALAENAFDNGVEFKFNTEVVSIKKCESYFLVETNKEIFKSKIIINAAGLHADAINNMINNKKYSIVGKKGEYCIFDKISGTLTKRTLFQVPNKESKGILVLKTLEGNLVVGPNAVDVKYKENLNINTKGLDFIIKEGSKSLENMTKTRMITTFVGVRPHVEGETDFVIREAENEENFINVIGIESPGLTAAPAIGEYVKDIVISKISCLIKTNFKENRVGIVKVNRLSLKQKNSLIKKDPTYGKVICKCESITEGEIIDAINRSLGATTVDGVKRRTRSRMGKCKGSGCVLPIMNIISKENNKKKYEKIL